MTKDGEDGGAVERGSAAQQALLPGQDEVDAQGHGERPEQAGEDERLAPALGKASAMTAIGAAAQAARAAPWRRSPTRKKAAADQGEEEAGDRARARGGERQRHRQQRPVAVEGDQGRQADRHAEGEGKAAAEQHRDRPRPEPERRQAGAGAVVAVDQEAEEAGGGDGGEPPATVAPTAAPSGGKRTL